MSYTLFWLLLWILCRMFNFHRSQCKKTFYLRQLTTNVFCIHVIKTDDRSTIYTYHEGIAKKGTNEVCSFLHDYLQDIPPLKIDLHLCPDSCRRRNKNHCLARFLVALNDTSCFRTIEHYYPVTGHSVLPCDKDFGVINRSLQKQDRIYVPHKLTEIIVSSAKPQKLLVKELKTLDIVKFKSW